MLYGELILRPSVGAETTLLRLRKAVEWPDAEHHEVDYGNFSGGIFLDTRLPYRIEDCLYIDHSQDLLVLMIGDIYNRAELADKLDIDTNLLSAPALTARLFLARGSDFVQELNGDFSIVIYQARTNSLYLFRDHLGISPLAYAQEGHALWFSSDMMGLCRTFYEGGRINMDPVISSVITVDNTLTPNDKVSRIKAGYFLIYEREGLAIKKYWQPEHIRTDHTLTQPQLFSEIKALLEDATRIRCDPRFRAGAHLSGGFDSSIVAVLARQVYQHQIPFYGYSWSPDNAKLPDNELDERELVKDTCKMAGIEPAFIHVEVNDFVKLIQNSFHNLMYFFEEKVLEMAKAHRTNLLFSGHGGDEFFSFGSAGVDMDLLANFHWKTFLTRKAKASPKAMLVRLVYNVIFPAINHVPFSSRRSIKDGLSYFKIKYRDLHRETLRRFYCYRSRRAYQLGLLANHHLSERTEYWASTGVRNGVVYRYPLLDRRIVEYMLKVPSKLLVKDGQYTRIIPREVSQGLLPESVRWRRGKTDPAFTKLAYQQDKDIGLLFIDDVQELKENPDLHFVDFDLLEKEIQKFRNNENYPEDSMLFGRLATFKMFHEFTKSYREPIEL